MENIRTCSRYWGSNLSFYSSSFFLFSLYFIFLFSAYISAINEFLWPYWRVKEITVKQREASIQLWKRNRCKLKATHCWRKNDICQLNLLPLTPPQALPREPQYAALFSSLTMKFCVVSSHDMTGARIFFDFFNDFSWFLGSQSYLWNY